MPKGRPTKYTKDKPDRLYTALAAGKSITQFAADEGLHKSTIYEWVKQHEAFSDAFTRGQEASQAYWETELQKMMYDRNVNAPLVKLYFANRFNWHDKPEPADPQSQPEPVTVNIQVEDGRINQESD